MFRRFSFLTKTTCPLIITTDLELTKANKTVIVSAGKGIRVLGRAIGRGSHWGIQLSCPAGRLLVQFHAIAQNKLSPAPTLLVIVTHSPTIPVPHVSPPSPYISQTSQGRRPSFSGITRGNCIISAALGVRSECMQKLATASMALFWFCCTHAENLG